MIRLYNTLTRKKEDLQTLEPGIVKMYVCGPTVYNEAHVGHAMSALVFDIIRRYLEYSGYNVRHVMNYTDVDDKIINRANQMGIDPFALAQTYIDEFHEDLQNLNILQPTIQPRATREIDQIISMVQKLIDTGYAYPIEGDVYFRVQKDPDYGKLSGRRLDDMQAGSRIDVDDRKEHPMDFALWKGAKPGEPAWDSPWGKGRPGWHIECSAMNLHHLGEQIDIHGGGNDLIFPHHENEIAQTESLTHKPFATYWVHNGMLQLGGEKMSKSLGNTFTLREMMARGYQPDAIRYLLASVPYRKKLNFTFDALDAAANAIERLRNYKLRLETARFPAGSNAALDARAALAVADYEAALDDDLNTAEALGAVFEFVRETNTAMDAGEFLAANVASAKDVLARFDRVFDILEPRPEAGAIPDAAVQSLVDERNAARKTRNFARADEIRQELLEKGVILEDTKDGVRWKRK